MANYTVTTLVDENGTGTDLSLREALALANGDPTTVDTVTFDDALSGQTLTLVSGNGHLTIAGDVIIDGDLNDNGAPDITIDGNDATRLFFVDSGTVTLQGLALVNGRSQGGNGSDGRTGGGGGLGAGAAVFVDTGAAVRLEDVSFGVGVDAGNEAHGGNRGLAAGGGGGGGGLGGFGNADGSNVSVGEAGKAGGGPMGGGRRRRRRRQRRRR